MSYEVHTPVYEGPVRPPAAPHPAPGGRPVGALARPDRRRVPHRARAARALDLDVATEFLLIAATLVELKTRRLLPGADDLELDEDLLRFEERDLLLARLLECKTFKDAAAAFSAPDATRRAERGPRRAGPRSRSARWSPTRSNGSGPSSCWRAARRALAPSSRRSSTPTTSRRSGRASPTRSSSCSIVCPERESVSLPALVAGDATERLDVIVRFLAVPGALQAGRRRPRAAHELRRPAGPASRRGRGRARRGEHRRLGRADRVAAPKRPTSSTTRRRR